MHTDIDILPRNTGLLKSFQERRKWRKRKRQNINPEGSKLECRNTETPKRYSPISSALLYARFLCFTR